MRLNYISNLHLASRSGGWTGINYEVHRQLHAHFDVNYVGPINPASDYRAKVLSKLNRIAGRPGAFHFFSARRLDQIAQVLCGSIDDKADADFFHGPTPWIHYRSSRPYFLYTDACFSTYIDVYHEKSQFLDHDLQRIFETEAEWLGRAACVFFGTNWALERAADDYELPRENLISIGAAGSIKPPAKDMYSGGLEFLFIAVDFEAKGGRICAAAFDRLRETYGEATLTLVGAQPPADVLAIPGVRYVGYLHKDSPQELAQLTDLMARAFALVHPTSSDIQPLVICEAAYFGCPTISSRSFGIPELVEDKITGILIDPPLNPQDVTEAMLALCNNLDSYWQMRRTTRERALRNLTWESVGEKLSRIVSSRISCDVSSAAN